jgi:hypothetical protein
MDEFVSVEKRLWENLSAKCEIGGALPSPQSMVHGAWSLSVLSLCPMLHAISRGAKDCIRKRF